MFTFLSITSCFIIITKNVWSSLSFSAHFALIIKIVSTKEVRVKYFPVFYIHNFFKIEGKQLYILDMSFESLVRISKDAKYVCVLSLYLSALENDLVGRRRLINLFTETAKCHF